VLGFVRRSVIFSFLINNYNGLTNIFTASTEATLGTAYLTECTGSALVYVPADWLAELVALNGEVSPTRAEVYFLGLGGHCFYYHSLI